MLLMLDYTFTEIETIIRFQLVRPWYPITLMLEFKINLICAIAKNVESNTILHSGMQRI